MTLHYTLYAGIFLYSAFLNVVMLLILIVACAIIGKGGFLHDIIVTIIIRYSYENICVIYRIRDS